MAIEAVGSDTLERLSGLGLDGTPVLSVYLDLDPARGPVLGTREVQLEALLRAVPSELAEADAERVRALLEAQPTSEKPGVMGLAIFSSAEAGFLEAIRLPESPEPVAVLDSVPWLEPLAAAISPGDWGVVVLSRNMARLFRGGPRSLTQFAVIHDDVHGKHAQGGLSQARFQRGIEEEVSVHVRRVAERLLRAHRRRAIAHLVIVASGELRPLLERSVGHELSGALAGTVDADLVHAPVEKIVLAVAPVTELVERDRERKLAARIDQELGTGGRAAAGLDEVLSTLEQKRIETLLVPERASLDVARCPRCGRLSTGANYKCALDGAALDSVDGVQHAIERAVEHSAVVVVVRHETDWLAAHGQIAALLRW
jgi:peptide chain release factor subunit 1